MANYKKDQSSYDYYITVQDFSDTKHFCTLTIENKKTKEKQTVPIIQLIQNLEILKKLSPEDLSIVNYLFAEYKLIKAQ